MHIITVKTRPRPPLNNRMATITITRIDHIIRLSANINHRPIAGACPLTTWAQQTYRWQPNIGRPAADVINRHEKNSHCERTDFMTFITCIKMPSRIFRLQTHNTENTKESCLFRAINLILTAKTTRLHTLQSVKASGNCSSKNSTLSNILASQNSRLLTANTKTSPLYILQSFLSVKLCILVSDAKN